MRHGSRDVRCPRSATVPRTSNPSRRGERLRLRSLGGIVTFDFDDAGLNQTHVLNAIIRTALARCRRLDLPLTQGVSFGFTAPRISASSAMAEDSPPFLRLSAGAETPQVTERVAEVVAVALRDAADALSRLGCGNG